MQWYTIQGNTTFTRIKLLKHMTIFHITPNSAADRAILKQAAPIAQAGCLLDHECVQTGHSRHPIPRAFQR